MIDISYILLPIIAFLAYVLKAMTGFGPAIVVISLGTLFIAPQQIITTSSILDLIAGAILLTIDWKNTTHSYWISLTISITIGAIIGSIFLKIVPPAHFHKLLSGAILIVGIWFIINQPEKNKNKLLSKLPQKCSKTDISMTFFGGLCGGLFGISGPPIIWNFGRQFAKKAFRQVLVPIFLAAAIARTSMYSTMGLANWEVLKLVIVALPGMFLGLYVGNKIFFKLSELKFRRIVGIILVMVGMKLLVF